MSPDRPFLSTSAFPCHGFGKVARFVLSQIEIAIWKASGAPLWTLRCYCPAIDNCIGDFGLRSYITSDFPDSEITEDYCSNKRIVGRRYTDNCWNCWCNMAFLYRPPTLT
jgi:hypothetical protein